MNSSALISMMVKQKVKGNALQWNIFSALFLMLAMRAESRSSEKVIKYSRNCWKKWCCNQDVAHGMHVFKMLHLNRSLTKSGRPENKRILCVCRDIDIYIYIPDKLHGNKTGISLYYRNHDQGCPAFLSVFTMNGKGSLTEEKTYLVHVWWGFGSI